MLTRFSCFTVNDHIYANVTEHTSVFSAKLSLQTSLQTILEMKNHFKGHQILYGADTFNFFNKVF